QVRFHLVNASSVGVRFTLTGPGGLVLFSGLAGDSDPVTLTASGQYALTAYTLPQVTASYSFAMIANASTPLTAGVPYQGHLTGSGQYQLFQVNLTSPGPLHFVLNDASAADRNELYVRYGSPPTRGVYTDRSAGGGQASQDVMVPLATPGTWYVL